MAFKIQKSVGWAYGTGEPPYKYEVAMDLECALEGQADDVATFSLKGEVNAVLFTNDHNIPWQASDYALLNVANNDPVDYPFTAGTSYFQRTLPFVPNAPQKYLDDILIEFRGDIFAGDYIPHAISLYVKGQGVVVATTTKTGLYSFKIDTTFDLPLTGDPKQEVLIWNNSYCNSATDYHWDNHQVWASLFDFDYRPGMTWDGKNWMSHNRDGGVCNVYTGSWTEMRTSGYPDAKGNPPLLYRDGGLWNQAKIGQE